MTSPPEWTRKTLKSFTDAATEAVGKTIGEFKRETRRELELRDAQFAARTAALDYRIQAVADLERRLAERLAGLKDGRDGVAPTLDDVRPAIADYVDHVLAGWQRPKDGTSVTVEDVEPVLRDLVSEAVGKIPAPKDGRSITIDDVRPIIAEEVAEAVARLRQDHHQAPHWTEPRADAWPYNLGPIIDVEPTPNHSPLEHHVTQAVALLPRPSN
ncbi:MAG TPA: hypothetical protein EYP98_02710 [Planctomycetes bacterium]|nr:hypothetical protein [Planctomycetota bacterium]